MSAPNWGEPRSALAVIGDTFRLYGRYPLPFFVLAAAVLLPYEGLLIALTGVGPSGQSAGLGLLVTVLGFGFVTPLISALHVQAVAAAREGERPRIVPVAKQGLRVLPVVAAASIAATLGMFVGFLALFVPGVILSIRWFVVAQAAAIEDEGWLPALRRSGDLVDDNYGHVFAVLLCVGAVTLVPIFLLEGAFAADSTAAIALLVGTVISVLTASFAALAGAVLYFELRLRMTARGEGAPSEATKSPLDPRAHSDEERPRGWYVDPAVPSQMHYWGGPGADGWAGTARTPRKTRRAWKAEAGLSSPSR